MQYQYIEQDTCIVSSSSYVMQSHKMSVKSVKFYFNFSDWLYTLFAKLPSTRDPIEIGQLVPQIRAAEDLQKQ